MNEPKIKFGLVFVNGEYYQSALSRNGEPIFEKVKKEKVEVLIKRAEEIAKKIRGSLDPEKVIFEALLKLPDGEDGINKLYNMLFKSKKTYHPITRRGHCCDMKVGNFLLPIVE